MKKTLTLLFSLLAANGFAQTLTIDLSKNLNTTFTQTINPQTFTDVTLVNRVLSSKVTYTISVIKQSHQAGGLTLPAGISIPFAGGGALGDGAGLPACVKLETATTKLDGEASEAAVPADIADLKTEIKAASASTECAADILAAQKKIDATTVNYPITPIALAAGDELLVTVVKDDKNKWIYDFKTEQVNHFSTFFGFTYVPDVFTSFPTFYAKAQDAANTYLITRMNNPNKGIFQNISPTIMFTDRFFRNPDAHFKFGLTGGFTYNTQTLGALFGPSLVIRDVLSINTGITFIQKNALLGQYQEGQLIKDNLTFDQLHSKVWTYDMFISIGLNIPELFNKKSAASGAAAAPATTSAASTPAH